MTSKRGCGFDGRRKAMSQVCAFLRFWFVDEGYRDSSTVRGMIPMETFMLKKIPFAILFVFIVCNIAFPQQGENDGPSPRAQAQCNFSDEDKITVDYFSPSMRGRRIFGGLVPYGKVWRTGDEAATFVTDEDLVALKGTNIPAGSYTIVMVPNPGKWTLIINKNTVYESGELVRVPMSVKRLSAPVEQFTISFDQGAGSCTMRVSWENTQASLEFAKRNTDLPLREFVSGRPQK